MMFPPSARLLALSLLCCPSPLLRAAEPVVTASRHEERVRAHVGFLSDDLLEGRAAGTRGHELAAAYLAAQFARLGLEPAGTNGFRQPMRFRESQLDLESGRFTIRHASGETSLQPLNDMTVRPGAAAETADVAAPAVFVGFGISAPEFGYDDFAAGEDVRGKVAVILAGSPAQLPSTARAHYSRRKTAELARRGAVAIVSIETPAEERRTPWALAVSRGRFPTMRLVEPDGALFEAYPEIRATASTSRAAGAALFQHAPRPIEAVFAASERGEPQAFALGIEIALAARATVKDSASANVLGRWPGSDPALAGEPLVITAHLDHIGLGPVVAGDRLYNGALDNALGTAVLLEIAERIAAGPRLPRPVLFAALTAEEKGLLGAYYLSRHAPPGVARFAANLNLDMPVLLGPAAELIVLGAEHSTLGPVAAAAAARSGFALGADPQPEEVFFVRSDQYPFVRAGVPAIAPKAGRKSSDPAVDLAARQEDFRKNHYHKPSDTTALPIHWPSVVRLADFATEVTLAVATDPVAPSWLPGDFFGTRFGGARAK